MWNVWLRDRFIEWMKDVVDGARTCSNVASARPGGSYDLEIRETLKAQVTFYDRVTG